MAGEVLEAGRYTLVRIDTVLGPVWAAVPAAEIPEGSSVTLKSGSLMKNFLSKSLIRRFDQIYFTGGLLIERQEDTPNTVTNPHHAISQGHTEAADAQLDYAGIRVPLEVIDIQSLLADPAAYTGKQVTIMGRIAKFTPDILDYNWIHLRDGSSSEADVAATTKERAAVGDTVILTGTVAQHRDFGFGYKYDVLIEDAVLKPEPTPFAPSRLRTTTGTICALDKLDSASNCGDCHERQLAEWKGSGHSQAHHDGIYRAFAELARKEGGEDLYRFCSSCHAPLAIAAGIVPGSDPEKDSHRFVVDEGVTCDACHTTKSVDRLHKGGGANASLVIEAGEVRYGPIKNPTDEASHESSYSELHTRSEFCSACHTLLHPINGLVIENTYAEWRESPFAKAGIQCQDCHMRTVEQAVEVAQTMRPLQTPGPAVIDGPVRNDVKSHYFAGANSNDDDSHLSQAHAAMARKRLQTATEIKLLLPEKIGHKDPFELTVSVANLHAGHAIPSSITELREVWIELILTDANGKTVFASGEIDATGKVDPEARMFNAKLADKDGNITYLPWRAVTMVSERLIGPKQTVKEVYTITPPRGIKGPLTARARLRYRSAPQNVMDELFGKGTFSIETVDMATSEGTIPVSRWR